MPILTITTTDPEIQFLKTEGANVIVGKLKALLKHRKTTFSKNTAEGILCETLYGYVKALETPYPPSLVKAGFWYTVNPSKHIETSTRIMENIKGQMIPVITNLIETAKLNENGLSLLQLVYKHLLALKLAEEARQALIETNKAGKIDTMAHDILQKQEMNFRKVSDHAVTPLLDVCHKKISSFEAALDNKDTASAEASLTM